MPPPPRKLMMREAISEKAVCSRVGLRGIFLFGGRGDLELLWAPGDPLTGTCPVRWHAPLLLRYRCCAKFLVTVAALVTA